MPHHPDSPSRPEPGARRAAYSPSEFASLFGCARSTVYAAIGRGELHSVKLGGRRLIPASEIRRLLGEVHV
jgi:excisionase family DNA binding protein